MSLDAIQPTLNSGSASSTNSQTYPNLVCGKGAKRLLDMRHKPKWSTLAPRFGQFSVDSVSMWKEFRDDPFHSCANMPLLVLLTGYLFCYLVFTLFTALLFFLIALGDDEDSPSLSPDASWKSCVQCAWQSVTTVGYGGIATEGFWASGVCATAVVLSLVFDAIGIGVFYQRLSNASIKARSIVHSREELLDTHHPTHTPPCHTGLLCILATQVRNHLRKTRNLALDTRLWEQQWQVQL